MFRLDDLVRFQARRRPNHTAVVCGTKRLTYKELDSYVDYVADDLQSEGLVPRDRVGILARNSERFVAVFLALHRIGVVPVLMNRRLTIDDCKAVAVRTDCVGVVHDVSPEAVKENMQDVPSVQWSRNISEDAFDFDRFGATSGSSDSPRRVEMNPEDEALIFFTSGTQGGPKAAVHSQGGIMSWVGLQASSEWTIGANDISLVYPPLFHLGGMQVLLHTLMAGATIVLMDHYDSGEILSISERENVTQLCVIPPTKILDIAQRASDNHTDLAAMKLVLLMGGANREQYCEAVFDSFPNASYMHALGHSENASTCTMVMNRTEYSEHPERRTSVGQVAGGSTIRLVDENGDDVAVGERGRVVAKSPAMMKGYLGQDSFTDGWLETGDVLSRDEDGFFYYHDRIGFLIKSGGENVSPTEVEGAILSHPDVADCAVFGLPDDCLGEIVVAAVVCKPGASPDDESIVHHCRSQIAGFKRPRKVYFVDELPRTAIGKIAKAELIAAFR